MLESQASLSQRVHLEVRGIFRTEIPLLWFNPYEIERDALHYETGHKDPPVTHSKAPLVSHHSARKTTKKSGQLFQTSRHELLSPKNLYKGDRLSAVKSISCFLPIIFRKRLSAIFCN
jgi:hypothetical protein